MGGIKAIEKKILALKGKVLRVGQGEGPPGKGPTLRVLKKRLRRAQRKRRVALACEKRLQELRSKKEGKAEPSNEK